MPPRHWWDCQQRLLQAVNKHQLVVAPLPSILQRGIQQSLRCFGVLRTEKRHAVFSTEWGVGTVLYKQMDCFHPCAPRPAIPWYFHHLALVTTVYYVCGCIMRRWYTLKYITKANERSSLPRNVTMSKRLYMLMFGFITIEANSVQLLATYLYIWKRRL